MKYQLVTCACGSGLYREAVHDGHGIFLFYACEKCRPEKSKKYREDIYMKYQADEPIEPEE